MDTCIDCGDPAVSHKRCSECLAEVAEAMGREPCAQCGQPFVGRRTARYCSLSCSGLAQAAQHVARHAAARPALCIEPGCSSPLATTNKRFRSRCSPCRAKKWPQDPAKAKARQRRKTHTRKARTRYADFTADQEREMRAKATCCPLCSVRMTDVPYLPASKELDHIVPLGVGGTHTLGNVRIICRACNIRRPRDGSDYTGPVTLFAVEVA